MSSTDDVFKEVQRRLERALSSPDCPPDVRQLMKCVDPAFERCNDLVSDNKRLSAMQHFVLSDLKDVQAKEQKLEQERRTKKRIPKADVAIQEPDRNSDESSSEDEKPVARSSRKRPPEVLPELDFVSGITDAALLKFDPLSRPVPTPWRQRTKGVKAHFAKYKKDLISNNHDHDTERGSSNQTVAGAYKVIIDEDDSYHRPPP